MTRVVSVAVLVAVLVVAAWIARSAEGRGAVLAADAALARGDRVEAIVFARAAAEARCPGCTAPDLGYARLEAIAKEAESRGDEESAVAAWRAVRSAALASALLSTSPPRRERADAEIARIEHRIDTAAAAVGGTAAPAASEERLRAALASSTLPSGLVFMLLALGGGVFFLGATRFVRGKTLRAVDLAIALGGGAVAVGGLLLF